MAAVMRTLLTLGLLLLCVPARAEPVSTFLTWVGTSLGASAASAYAVGAFVVSTVISLGTQAYANNQQKKRAHQEAARKMAQDIANLSDRRVTLLQADSPHAVIYGSPGRVGGSLVGMVTTGSGAQLTHLIIVFASHPCEAIEEIYIDDDPVQAGPDGWTTNPTLIKQASGFLDFDHGPMVRASVHLSPGGVDTADAWLISACNLGGAPGMWTDDHKLSGFTYAVVTVNKVMGRFQGGPPAITAKIRGKNTIYDPRTGTRGYSRNPALCTADFIMSEEGYQAALDQIEPGAWIAAANACDQEVYGPEADADAENYGNSRALYVCDGMFRSDQNRDSTRQQLEEAMAGFSLQSAGVWRLQAGAWSTPVLALSEHDMLAPITVVQTCNPGERVYNTARGTYVNAARNGVSEDFKAYQNPVFLGLDPHEKIIDRPLAFTGSHVRCHQLARVAVERSRGGLVLRIHPKMLAWHLQPGDRILLTSAFYGFTDKAFIVTDWSYSRNAPLTLEVLEDVPAYYDTADEVLADAAPNSNLPSPFEQPQAPQNLQVHSGVDELAVQGGALQVRARVSWNRSTSGNVLNGGAVRLQWRLGTTDPEDPNPPGVDPWKTVELPGDAVEAFVLGLDVGQEYTVRVQFRTNFVESPWSWAGHLLSGNTPPAAVEGLALSVATDGILARWSPPAGIDLIDWDRTQIGRGATPEAAQEDVRFDGHALAALLGWFPAGEQTVWALHHSRGGLWSEAVSGGITILPPAQAMPEASISNRTTLHIVWQDCRTTQPLRYYEVRRGFDYATAAVVDHTTGTTYTTAELTFGQHRHWVTAVDMAGNRGAAGYVDALTLESFDAPIRDLRSLVDASRDEWARLHLQEMLGRDEQVQRARAGAVEQLRVVTQDNRALAERYVAVAAAVDENFAIVSEQIQTLATDLMAEAHRIDIVSAATADNTAAIVAEQLARVSADEALATSQETIQSQVGGLVSTVDIQGNTLASLNGNVAAQYMIRTEVIAGGKRALAGLSIGVSASGTGTDVQSEIIALASRFLVAPDAGSIGDAPFEVVGGQVRIKSALIGNASIGTLQLNGRAVVQPMFAQGTPTASIAFTVPAGQAWDIQATAGFDSVVVPIGVTDPGVRNIELAISGPVSLTKTGLIVPVARGKYAIGEDDSTKWLYPSTALVRGTTLTPGSYTITASSTGGDYNIGVNDLAVIVGKAGA